MNDIRQKKLESALVREMALTIQKRKAKADGIGLVSVTRVELRPDLSEAVFFVSPFGSDEENRDTMQALRRLAGQFQSQISRDLHLRSTPHFVFRVDTSIKEGDRILDLMERTSKDKKPPE
ncbi:MAG: 30S ribosome-binding factor RbfA [Leptospirales bacterium]|nr:30S ribosome-binding factor RbfA [Leptospirales bacterium]